MIDPTLVMIYAFGAFLTMTVIVVAHVVEGHGVEVDPWMVVAAAVWPLAWFIGAAAILGGIIGEWWRT